MIPIRTDISPSLHPEALAGDAPVLERDDRPLGKQAIAAAREALTTAYETIGALNDATRALEATSTRRERRNGRVLPVRERNDAFVKSADAALARATSAIDRRSAELARVRDALAARVNEALSLPEHKTPVGIAQGAEVRGYVKALKASERVRFVDAAIESKDRATVAAVIHGGPAYLSDSRPSSSRSSASAPRPRGRPTSTSSFGAWKRSLSASRSAARRSWPATPRSWRACAIPRRHAPARRRRRLPRKGAAA